MREPWTTLQLFLTQCVLYMYTYNLSILVVHEAYWTPIEHWFLAKFQHYFKASNSMS